MVPKKLLSTLFLTLFATVLMALETPKKFLFIEPTEATSEFTAFDTMMKEHGIDVTHHPFYSSFTQKELDDAGGVFFAPSPILIKSLIVMPEQKIYPTILEMIAQQKNKVIGIVLPRVPRISSQDEDKGLATLLTLLKKFNVTNNPQEFDTVVTPFVTHHMEPDTYRSARYHTALWTAHKRTEQVAYKDESYARTTDKSTGKVLSSPLPVQHPTIKSDHALAPLFPLALYLQNKNTGNHFFITSDTELNVSELTESCGITPLQPQLRTELMEQLFAACSDMLHLSGHIKERTGKNLPHTLTHEFEQEQKEAQRIDYPVQPPYEWLNKQGIRCAFLNLEPCAGKVGEIAESIIAAGNSMIWIESYPEFYFGPNAIKPELKSAYLERMREFTAELRSAAEKLEKPVPHIFFGMNITSNFGKTLPEHPVTDIYGTHYRSIPSPLDKKMWDNEVVAPYKEFYEQWQIDIGNGLPLAGALFDFEMYHAPQELSNFPSYGDFSEYAWQDFVAQQPNREDFVKLASFDDKRAYLLANDLLHTYINFQEQRCKEIGTHIKESIRSVHPTALFGTYNSNLPHTWAYKGLYAGLSSAEEPLIGFTFNTNFYRHNETLKQNNIWMHHAPVYLLSKLQKPADAALIGELSKTHDGVWFNRWSQLAQKRTPEVLENVEATPLETPIVVEAIAGQFKN